MKKVEFLANAAGSYGMAHKGDKLVLNPKTAKALEEKGIVKVTGDAAEGSKESIPESGALRIADNTGKKEKAETVTVSEKNSKAGPNDTKKK
jgi:hypothetical protein